MARRPAAPDHPTASTQTPTKDSACCQSPPPSTRPPASACPADCLTIEGPFGRRLQTASWPAGAQQARRSQHHKSTGAGRGATPGGATVCARFTPARKQLFGERWGMAGRTNRTHRPRGSWGGPVRHNQLSHARRTTAEPAPSGRNRGAAPTERQAGQGRGTETEPGWRDLVAAPSPRL